MFKFFKICIALIAFMMSGYALSPDSIKGHIESQPKVYINNGHPFHIDFYGNDKANPEEMDEDSEEYMEEDFPEYMDEDSSEEMEEDIYIAENNQVSYLV